MTQQEFLDRIDNIMCGTSNAERAYLADLYDEVTKPHWIRVEDELPPRFVLDPNESMNVITYGLHTMVNWYDYERGEWVRDSEITHWMPLPKAPEA